jgi:hypothetical protein
MELLTRPHDRGVGRFINQPEVEYLSGGTRVRLLKDLVYMDPTPRIWRAPKGLVSDGASIPRLLWPVVGSPLSGPYVGAALLHDARYRLGDCSKEEADLMLWDAALCGGTSEMDAEAIAEGVAFGGHSAWAKNERKREACAGDYGRLLEWV